MSQAQRTLAGAWLTVIGAVVLIASLFLTWSHQISPAEHRIFHGAVIFGVPANPTAWQVYAIAGEVLAALAVVIAAAGLWGQRRVQALTFLAVIVGLSFVIHAAGTAPTNGLLLATDAGQSARYLKDSASTGPGETVAMIALTISALGLLLGCVPGRAGRSPGTRSAADRGVTPTA